MRRTPTAALSALSGHPAQQAQPAFLPSGPGTATPGRRGRLVLLCGFLGCSSAIALAAVVVKPTTAHAFKLLYGSVFINDNVSPVAIDLASGKPTVRLSNAVTAVGAASTGDLDLVPVGQSTLMLNSRTGEFNMLDAAGLLLKPTGGGVRLPTAGSGSVTALASGSSAYVIRSASAGTQVYLVDAATVAGAVRAGSRPAPRASTSLTQPLAQLAGAVTTAHGALWLLTGGGSSSAVQELTVPAASDAGTTLTSTLHGIVTGPAALETIAGSSDTVALATSHQLQLFFADGHYATLSHASPSGLDRIVSAHDLSGRAEFLLHGSNGWSLLSAGLNDTVAQLHTLPSIPSAAVLVPPAANGSSLYLLRGDGDGHIWTVDSNGRVASVAGAPRYPVLPGEKLDLSGAEVLSDGSRVIVNARANFEAEVIFTDGSHPPLSVDKHSAVQLDPSGTQALVVSHRAGGPKGPPTRKPPTSSHPVTTPTVNNRVDCRTADQTPHIPLVRLVQRGSRSVQLAWTYPLLDTQDCVPSTYTISATALDTGAPRAPGTATVQGQNGANLVGLFPDTAYRIVVSAFLNGRGTGSAPLEVRTSVEGPAAPSNVTTTVDSAGNWVLHWQSCGGIADGCVPSTTWQLVPTLCDGLGLSTTPQNLLVIGDPTQHSFSAVYSGNAALLGRGLSFQVAGIGVTGVVGTPAAATGCAYSWTPPAASAISLEASAPAATGESNTTTTTVTAHFVNGQTADLGGVGGTLTYQLLSGGSVVDSVGPTTQPSVTFSDIHPGVHYQVRATAAAPHHPESATTIGPVDVQPASALWPAPSVTAGFANTSASAGTLTVTVTLPAGTDTHGETFDLAGGSLDCGNAHLDLTQTNVVSGKPITFDVPRTIYNSTNTTCTVSTALAQDSSTALNPPLYGAGQSASATSAPMSIDAPTLDTTAADFTASWVDGAPPGHPQIAVSYTGSNSTLAGYAHDWSLTANTGSSTSCGSSSANPAASPAIIDASKSCVSKGSTWSVAIAFTYFGANGNYTIDVGGSKPVPVDPTQMTFAAVWTSSSTLADAHVQLQYTGPYNDATLSGLQWSATVISSGSPGVTCGSSTGYPQADGTGPNIAVDLAACPPTNGSVVATYTVQLSFTDPNYSSSGSYVITVSGTVPQ